MTVPPAGGLTVVKVTGAVAQSSSLTSWSPALKSRAASVPTAQAAGEASVFSPFFPLY